MLLSVLLVYVFWVVCCVAFVFLSSSYYWLSVGLLQYVLLVSCVLCLLRRFLVQVCCFMGCLVILLWYLSVGFCDVTMLLLLSLSLLLLYFVAVIIGFN